MATQYYFVSDLHMGGDGQLQLCDYTDEFIAFLKDLADKKSEIFDEDLHALVSDEAVTPEVEHFQLLSITAHTETGENPFARVVLAEDNAEKSAESRGAGPVDATFSAIESIAHSQAELLLYSVNNVTQGTDSQGEVTVRLSKGGRIVNAMPFVSAKDPRVPTTKPAAFKFGFGDEEFVAALSGQSFRFLLGFFAQVNQRL